MSEREFKVTVSVEIEGDGYKGNARSDYEQIKPEFLIFQHLAEIARQ